MQMKLVYKQCEQYEQCETTMDCGINKLKIRIVNSQIEIDSLNFNFKPLMPMNCP